jgi:hypothetical protein
MRSASGSNRECRTPGRVTWTTWGAIATLCLAVHGCDTVTGGAVELSWKLRPTASSLSDKFVDCNSGQVGSGPVTRIRLHWEVDNNDGDARGKEGSQAWLCEYNHGVTGFDLAEGTAKLWVTPECEDGPAAPETYIAPAIVQRSVGRGNTVSLGAVELVVSASYCREDFVRSDAGLPTQPCICDLAPGHTTR